MIPKFRKIRNSLFSSSTYQKPIALFVKYLFYAVGEIFLVVIGILIALQINNWNLHRLQKIEEKKILQEIKNALTSDLTAQIDNHIQKTEIAITKVKVIHEHLANDIPYHDSLSAYFKIISRVGWRYWAPQTTPFETLKSKGVDIIENDHLKNTIMDLYNIDYISLEESLENYATNILEYGRPLARSIFNFNDDMFLENEEPLKLIPIDYEGLRDHTVFRNFVRVMQIENIAHLKTLRALRSKVESIIEKIEEEISH